MNFCCFSFFFPLLPSGLGRGEGSLKSGLVYFGVAFLNGLRRDANVLLFYWHSCTFHKKDLLGYKVVSRTLTCTNFPHIWIEVAIVDGLFG